MEMETDNSAATSTRRRLRKTEFWPPRLGTICRNSSRRTPSFELLRQAAVQEVLDPMPNEGVLVRAVRRRRRRFVTSLTPEFAILSLPNRDRLYSLFCERMKKKRKSRSTSGRHADAFLNRTFWPT